MELESGGYGSPRWTYEILDCAMPMTFDTYSNCAHQCVYCFSFFQRAIGATADDYLNHKVRAVNVDKIRRMFTDPDNHGGQFKNYIKRKMVLQWGGLSDGFDWYERKFRKSLELLRLFRELDYPISISTKGVWFLDDPEYVEVLKGAKNVHFKYSIITSDEEHVKKIEPGTPSTAERFRALRRLNDLEIGATTFRFRPFIIGTSDLHIEELMKSAKDAGCYSVTTEFLCWESRASVSSRTRLDAMSKVLGYDVWQFYLDNSSRSSGLLRLNYDLKRPYIKRVKEAAAANDLKFFVSDAHHKEESYHAGCCGLPETGPLSNVNHGQYAHAILIAKKNNFVRWSDIKDDAYSLLKDIPVIQAEGFPSDTAERAKRQYQSMYDYMHDIWNNPKSWQSPARYFGGSLVPSAPDEFGDVVYLYNKPFIESNERVESVQELAQFLRMQGRPNAERFDEMTADGTNYAHVGYPIYVFSSGRSKVATTPSVLEAARISNWILVVPENETDDYLSAYPNTDVVGSPGGGIGEAKRYIQNMCREAGYEKVWFLDDDITGFVNAEGESTLRAAFSEVERYSGGYSNISCIGFPVTNSEYQPSNYLYEINTEVKACTLVNLNSADFKPYTLLEDTAFQLDAVKRKYVNVTYNKFNVVVVEPQFGGCTKYYVRGDYGGIAESIQKDHDDIVMLKESNNPVLKKDLIILWELRENSLSSVDAEKLLKGE